MVHIKSQYYLFYLLNYLDSFDIQNFEPLVQIDKAF